MINIFKRFLTKNNELQAPVNSNEIDWNKIDLEKANFIFQEGEKYMRRALESYDSLDNKSASIRTFLAASLGALFVIFNLGVGDASSSKWPLIALFGGLCVALAILSFAHSVRKFPTIGTSPEELLKAKYNSEDLRFLICCQLQTYSTRIAKAKKINADKGRLINIALGFIAISYLVSFIMLIYRLLIS